VYGQVDLDNLARKGKAAELAYRLRWSFGFPRRLAYWIAGKWHGVR